MYKIKVGTKEKIAKYEGMRLWLSEMGEEQMIRVLLWATWKHNIYTHTYIYIINKEQNKRGAERRK